MIPKSASSGNCDELPPRFQIYQINEARISTTIMDHREPNIVHSGLSRMVTKDGVAVEVSIVRLETGTSWSLEVVNSSGTSTVWDDLFSSDEDAYAEFERTVAEEGIKTFSDGGKAIPFRR